MDLLALIVEDEESLGLLFTNALEAAGFKTQLISDGRTALDYLGEVAPQVLVLDLNLPQVSGMEIFEQVRDDDRFNDTRVMIVTANPMMADTLEEEADLVLLKPIGYKQLRDLATRLRMSYQLVYGSPDG